MFKNFTGTKKYCGSLSQPARDKFGNVHAMQIENCMELWKVLSEIKMLNHLRIEMCTMKPFIETDMCSQHSFVQLALKFVNLEQLELMENDNSGAPFVHFNNESQQNYTVFLSYSPSLVACFFAYIDVIPVVVHYH